MAAIAVTQSFLATGGSSGERGGVGPMRKGLLTAPVVPGEISDSEDGMSETTLSRLRVRGWAKLKAGLKPGSMAGIMLSSKETDSTSDGGVQFDSGVVSNIESPEKGDREEPLDMVKRKSRASRRWEADRRRNRKFSKDR